MIAIRNQTESLKSQLDDFPLINGIGDEPFLVIPFNCLLYSFLFAIFCLVLSVTA